MNRPDPAYGEASCTVASPRAVQLCNLGPSGATDRATDPATESMKLSAKAWFERNRPCNSPCNTPQNRATLPATSSTVGDFPAADPDALAERVAIVQEGAGVPAEWADGFARLEALRVPHGVDAAAWLAMMNAAGRFLDQWGGKAAALGWSAGDLFGLDPDAPLTRRDKRGAAFYLVGAEVLAVTAEAITLRIGGAVQRIVRRGTAAPAWEVGEWT